MFIRDLCITYENRGVDVPQPGSSNAGKERLSLRKEWCKFDWFGRTLKWKEIAYVNQADMKPILL